MAATQEEITLSMEPRSFLKSLSIFDWLWACLWLAGAIVAHQQYQQFMDGYEVGILYGAVPALVFMGWRWKAFRILSLAVAAISLFAIWIYGNDISLQEKQFFLKFMLSSQSAIMWMSALFVLATVTYFFALAIKSDFVSKVASSMTWSATTMGLVGLMVRWRESYLLGADIGHIPVSNLYEVFILFAIITALIYLYYEGRYKTRALGGFVLSVISASIAFLLWYTFDRHAHEIQPLIPALQSYWMKIHVPANFIGYGAFSLAAMVGVAYLFKARKQSANETLGESGIPALTILDDIMYKSIALGFAFFTIATVLGAMWAAEAWGGYWSWDPKETWALIVWLNYAAWLHLRLTKGWRGNVMAWWAIIGLFVTLFAFVGVNMFLAGLHSYGGL